MESEIPSGPFYRGLHEEIERVISSDDCMFAGLRVADPAKHTLDLEWPGVDAKLFAHSSTGIAAIMMPWAAVRAPGTILHHAMSRVLAHAPFSMNH